MAGLNLAGPAYYRIGFDIHMYKPILVMSLSTGWTAHVIEQDANSARSRQVLFGTVIKISEGDLDG